MMDTRGSLMSMFTFAAVAMVTILSTHVTAIHLDVTRLSKEINKLADSGLGVRVMQDYFNTLAFDETTIEGKKVIESLRNTLEVKLRLRVSSLKLLQESVEESFNQEEKQEEFEYCCDVTSGLEYDSKFGKEIDKSRACVRVAEDNHEDNPRSSLSENVINTMKDNYKRIPSLKWQYFGDERGVFTIYPAMQRASCSDYDNRIRPWYVETATPEPKNLVIVLQKSASMSERIDGDKTLMKVAIEAAITVLDTMNPSDRIGVIAFSDEAETLRGSVGDKEEDHLNCFSQQLAKATPANIDHLKHFIHSLTGRGGTSYVKALEQAFNLLGACSNLDDDMTERDQVILFLADGKVKQEDESEIMETVRMKNEAMENKVVILTVGVGEEDEESSFLEDLAKQNFESYGVEEANTTIGYIKPGDYTRVADSEHLRHTMARYYNFFSHAEKLGNEAVFSVPYQPSSGIGLMTTVALPVKYNGELKGVVGIDITLHDLLADITYFKESDTSYAFIYEVNTKAEGRTLLHPLLPAPVNLEDDPVFVHVTALEREGEFRDIVFLNSSRQKSGNATFASKRSMPRGNSIKEGVFVTSVESSYYWEKVGRSPYVVCFVQAKNGKQLSLKQNTVLGQGFQYHRTDLVKPPTSCNHFNRYASTAQSAVKFAPNAFEDPANYLESEEDADIILEYADYMNEETGNGANKYFKEGIKATVTATAKVDELWLNDDTGYEDFTLFRYIGTANGVFREFPGVRMNKLYDPTSRPWYARSKINMDVLTLSAPYRAASVQTEVITISKAITHSVHMNHKTTDEVIAVMGMDFTLKYFYNLLARVYEECDEDSYVCFVMDISGYLVVHKDFYNSEGDSNVEELHITEREPSIAEDLISERILRKRTCLNFQKIKDQNYYVTDTENWKNVNKLDNDEPCKRYQLTHVPDTNVFLGVIDISQRSTICEAEFICPCFPEKCLTTEDGGNECQCPCLSQTDYDHCNDKFTLESDDAPSCTPPSPSLSPVTDAPDSYESLHVCFQANCGSQLSESDCYALISCTWTDAGGCVAAVTVDSSGQNVTTVVIIVIVIVVILAVMTLIVVVIVIALKRTRSNSAIQFYVSRQTPDVVQPQYQTKPANEMTDICGTPSAPPKPESIYTEAVDLTPQLPRQNIYQRQIETTQIPEQQQQQQQQQETTTN
ncbi:VWFA and cache domain-containing protein 1-like [Ptychodera flava]|uniref:VWFA and cache domain-containing protein 1-like n=1 Tax=Ptychodera flava TaxID=63121 RepID=UPI00396A8F4B